MNNNLAVPPIYEEASWRLMTLNDVLADEIGQAFVNFNFLGWTDADYDEAKEAEYFVLFNLLAQEAELYAGQLVGNAWQNHLLDRLLDSESIVARKVRQTGPPQLGSGLVVAFKHDLKRLQVLYNLDSSGLINLLRQRLNNLDLPDWNSFSGLGSASADQQTLQRQELKQKLAVSQDWPSLIDDLLEYYHHNDNSPFSRYKAFRWVRENSMTPGRFDPVEHLDEQRFENLVGYAKERAVIIANTEQLLAGLPANNVLLYGARGTGKSSTVKALLSRYAERGLRLIEIHKSEMGDYPLIARLVRQRPEKFILFVDDLSFEADEVAYKDLKALLEGSLEARPANLLIYATSNRRHLVKEQFSDNAKAGDDEVNAWDSVEEKLSLSDRFGLIVTFLSPNQQQYLAIVDGLAAHAGIALEQEDLHRRALRWELSHSGRSGRTARQFIDGLAGELGLRAEG